MARRPNQNPQRWGGGDSGVQAMRADAALRAGNCRSAEEHLVAAYWFDGIEAYRRDPNNPLRDHGGVLAGIRADMRASCGWRDK